MKKLIIFIFAFISCLEDVAQNSMSISASDNYSSAQGLKDAYKDYFSIGVAINQANINDASQIAIIKKQFNSVTAELDWTPGMIHPKEGVWNFEKADKIANFCRENGIKMRGHCLCWHSQFADWMFTDKKGKPVKKEVFYQRLREHIHTVVNRYKDVVYAWNVVNEAMADNVRTLPNRETNPYRQSRHFQLCGDEFIAKAFEFAREADPNVLLFYNDYSCVDPSKRERIYNMVKKMKNAGVPIDGIGMQGHYNIYFPDEEKLEKAINRFSEIVQHIHITELDLRTNTESGAQLMLSRGEAKPQPAYIQTLQEDQYARLFKIFRKYKDVIDNVTFWNLSDKDSWLGVNNHPLLFDENLKAKRSLQIIRDFNVALDNHKPKEDFVPNPCNLPGQQYPMVNSEGYARFHIEAPEAKSVIVSLGLDGRSGTVLRKDKNGVWTGTTEGPLDPGFHYYHLTIDGGVFNDVGTKNYFDSGKWRSGIEIPVHGTDKKYSQKRIANNGQNSNYLEPVVNSLSESHKATLNCEVDINIPSNNKYSSNTFAVIIGNENYKNVEEVKYAINDAKVISFYIEKTLGVPHEQIKVLENATYNDIRIAVNWIAQAMNVCEGKGKAIIYYAGHGIPNESDNSAFLLPTDGIGNDPGSAYSLKELYKKMESCNAQSITIFLDACFSGSKRGEGMLTASRGVAIKVKQNIPQGNMIVFSASQGDETAYPYNDKQHGLFTYYLLKKLQDSRGEVTLGELSDYLIKEIKKASFVKNGKIQTPSTITSPKIRYDWRKIKLYER